MLVTRHGVIANTKSTDKITKKRVVSAQEADGRGQLTTDGAGEEGVAGIVSEEGVVEEVIEVQSENYAIFMHKEGEQENLIV